MANIIKLTPSAIERVKYLVSKSGDNDHVLRIGVEKGGCAGLTYSMDYIKDVEKTDEVVSQDGVMIAIESAAIMYLLGTEMDYIEEEFSSGFKFKNPNEVSACGCGESVHIVPLRQEDISTQS
tara:strand:- start:5113 stop:5481 length:369 start_codon:yes stop_codon:yes gene_type:complete